MVSAHIHVDFITMGLADIQTELVILRFLDRLVDTQIGRNIQFCFDFLLFFCTNHTAEST